MEPTRLQGTGQGDGNGPPADPWEVWKPTIERLWMVESRKLPDIVSLMKKDHGFDAVDHQYKYHFKKWKWKKSVPLKAKSAIATQLQTRAAAGKTSTAITFQGRPVDSKKIRRYLKENARKDVVSSGGLRASGAGQQVLFGPALPFSKRIFLNWNLPYGALRLLRGKEIDHLSPLHPIGTTPQDDIAVTTPSAGAPSPNDVPSPTSKALNMKKAVDRAHLFINGRHQDLIRSMNTEERVTISTWLYQFWFFSFKTAKCWGRGPRDWKADSLGFGEYQEAAQTSLPGTPSMIMNDNIGRWSHSESSPSSASASHASPRPSQLCRWVIHLADIDAIQMVENYVPSPPRDNNGQDPQDETTWTNWPDTWYQPQFPEKLRNGLENNDFSTIVTGSLPVAIPQVVKAAQKSPDELLKEAFGFSIIGRNVGLLARLLDQICHSNVNVIGLYPLHMAASYLDGANTCCDVFEQLLGKISILLEAADGNVNDLYVNELGHTVLDILMVTILKSHTSLTPDVVDDALRSEKRFVGEEIDICGRWDADSDCIRACLAEGKAMIPFSWKHKFCHTSAQAICHSIDLLYEDLPDATLSSPSGLFTKYCLACGSKMQLQPLHTLVMTAFHLARAGCEDEDLFGVLACLLCLVANGVDASRTADLSLVLLLGEEMPSDCCNHAELSPADLARSLTAHLPASSPLKVDIGWRLFCHVLRQCEQIKRFDRTYYGDSNVFGEHDDGHVLGFSAVCRGFHRHPFGKNKTLAMLWASVQAELATYRRLNEGESWLSGKFNLEALLDSLELGLDPAIGLLEEGLLMPFCICGKFRYSTTLFPTIQEISRRYFANLDVWNRATYRVV
ncbi:hypothetical protein AOQ84DRAFT_384874 [Glonium stellatum]|uniref:Clr5 domain-containing protein n=1 Tax=Glonium stellatum TaxID=574774 RepID=A0A8E2FD31_9PEZI|nr:hypothetical protein AOQ84DRAFT_384874 [Glonium stellatum]